MDGYFSSEELSTMNFGSVGNNVYIAHNTVLVGTKQIFLKSNIRIDSFSVLIASNGYLNIGNYVHISSGSYLACSGGVVLEDFVGISAQVKIFSASDDFTGIALTGPCVPEQYRKIKKEQIVLEKHVLIGAGTTILPGVTIGASAAVGAMSLVTKSLKPFNIYAGIPARFVKSRSQNHIELEKNLINSSFHQNKFN
jgi:galactoside O-acetyltransferase